MVLRRLFPNLSKNVVKFFNLKYMNEEVERFFTKIVENTVKYREENNITRYDFLDLLLALKNESEKYHDRFDDAEVEEFLSKFGHKGTKSNTGEKLSLSKDLLVWFNFPFLRIIFHRRYDNAIIDWTMFPIFRSRF